MNTRLRHCKYALSIALRERFPLGFEADRAYRSFRFAIVSERSMLWRVFGLASEIQYQKDICAAADITLFKIPIHVNDVKIYVKMLVREHYD